MFRRMRIAYVIAYCLGMLWFGCYLFFAATSSENQGAGFWTFMGVLAVAAAPCAVLWTLRRALSGSWLG